MPNPEQEPLVLDLSAADAREQAQKLLSKTTEVPESQLVPREMAITIKYTDPNGRVHSSTANSRIMNGQDKTLCDLTAMTLAGNQRLETMPPASQMRYLALARLEVQLRPCPDWLSEWASEDDVLLMKVFDHLEAHHLRYFRRDLGTGAPDKVESWLCVDSAAIAPQGDTDGE